MIKMFQTINQMGITRTEAKGVDGTWVMSDGTWNTWDTWDMGLCMDLFGVRKSPINLATLPKCREKAGNNHKQPAVLKHIYLSTKGSSDPLDPTPRVDQPIVDRPRHH